MALHEIVYVSLACEEMTTKQLQAILQASRVHNGQAGISGMLIYFEREFGQLLEGEADEVAALYGRIACDRRHQQVYKMWDEPITQRSFPGWSMAFVDQALIEAVPGTAAPSWLADGLRTSVKDSSTGKKLLTNLRDEFLERDNRRSKN